MALTTAVDYTPVRQGTKIISTIRNYPSSFIHCVPLTYVQLLMRASLILFLTPPPLASHRDQPFGHITQLNTFRLAAFTFYIVVACAGGSPVILVLSLYFFLRLWELQVTSCRRRPSSRLVYSSRPKDLEPSIASYVTFRAGSGRS